jgi:acetylornithine/succinyldiaminopimelate/putrescine aminotransferase
MRGKNEVFCAAAGRLAAKRSETDKPAKAHKIIFAPNNIQGVSEIGALILTGNRTRQKEQLFYLPFCRKTMFNSKKNLERFFTKIALRH